MNRIALRGTLALVATLFATLVLSACAVPSAPSSGSVLVAGNWRLTGTQSAPSADLQGQLLIARQDGDLITGSAGWDERDAVGVVRSGGGPLSGRVINDRDIDFDVTVAGVARRHVGSIRGDTVEGNWIQFSDGRSGTFRAVRGSLVP